MQPRIECGIATKAPKPPIRLYECVLHRVLGIGAITRVPHRELHNAMPVFANEFIERTDLAGLSTQH
jgi:hypothetical protein